MAFLKFCYQGKFAPNFDELIKSAGLDERFAGENPVVNGYIFKMTVQESSGTKPSFYSINADPQEGSVIRICRFQRTPGTTKMTEENHPAKADDPSI